MSVEYRKNKTGLFIYNLSPIKMKFNNNNDNNCKIIIEWL